MKAAVHGMNADLLGLQEVAFGADMESQAAVLATAAAAGADAAVGAGVEDKGMPYQVLEAETLEPCVPPTGDFRINGNALLARTGMKVLQHDVLHLNNVRCAHRVLVQLRGGGAGAGGAADGAGVAVTLGDGASGDSGDASTATTTAATTTAAPPAPNPDDLLWFVNTHLHHPLTAEAAATRHQQAEALCEWLDKPKAKAAASHVVVVGDFNFPQSEPGYKTMCQHGLRSAYMVQHKEEPAYTFHGLLEAPTKDTDPQLTTDYIWLSPGIQVLDTRLAANKPLATDATLYPSDHYAIVSRIKIK